MRQHWEIRVKVKVENFLMISRQDQGYIHRYLLIEKPLPFCHDSNKVKLLELDIFNCFQKFVVMFYYF